MDLNVWWGIGGMLTGLGGVAEIAHILRRAWKFTHPKTSKEDL